MTVPFWDDVLAMSRKVARATGLGYIGVDIVVDADHGPMLLEGNARPGLAIQIANARGLLPRLAEIDALLDRAPIKPGLPHLRQRPAAARIPGAVVSPRIEDPRGSANRG
jgi:hypothetical protein